MNTIACDRLKAAFGARQRPAEFLRSGLWGADKEDATEFLADLEKGKSIGEFFLSGIPYFTFLSDDAAIFHLPDFLQIIADDRTNLVTIIPSLDIDSGRRVLSKLTDGERKAVLEFFQTLKAEEDFAVTRMLIDGAMKLVRSA